ncbi:MAG: FKBP-type peptidyl-prolyl cis-trans isomerase [Sphingobacteriaceae bacterium]
MKKIKVLILLLMFSTILINGCKKSDPYDANAQLAQDDELIRSYLTANNITATKHESGVYYVISDPGSGNVTYTTSTSVKVNYKLRLLGGNVMEQRTDYSTLLGDVIIGWQIGISQIQKDGKIRLFVPSVYAYGPQQRGSIPANSILDFDIELSDVSLN